MKTKLPLFFSFFVFFLLNSAAARHKFKNISVADGLPHNIVLKMFQDAEGYMWFGTGNGLCRYDGKNFKTFLPDDNAPQNSLPYHIVSDMDMDEKKNIWVLTQMGPCVYDHNLLKIKNLCLDPDYKSLFKNLLLPRKITVGKDSIVWIVSSYYLHRIDLKLKKRKDYKFQGDEYLVNILRFKEDIYIASSKYLYKVNQLNEPERILFNLGEHMTDNQSLAGFIAFGEKFLFVIQGKGFVVYDPVKQTVEKFIRNKWNIPDQDFQGVAMNVIKNKLWFCVPNYGLHIYDFITGETEVYKANNYDPYALKNNILQEIFEDKNGQIWLSVYKKGINYIDINYNQFSSFYNIPNDPSSLPSSNVVSFFEDNENLWMGTFQSEIIRYNKKRKEYSTFKAGTANQKGMTWGGVISKIMKDDRGNMYFISWINSIYYLSKKDNPDFSASNLIFKNIFDEWNLKIERWSPRDAIIDEDQNLWIVSFSRGILRYNLLSGEQELYKKYNNDTAALGNGVFWCITKGKNGDIWIGSEDRGLFKYNFKSKEFKLYTHNENDKNSISSNHIKCIYVDSDGTLWIGTGGAGICHFDPGTEKNIGVYNYKKDGISNNVIYGILEDSANNLWLTSDNGLTCFNKRTKEVKVFTTSHGLQNLEFNINSYYKNSMGEFFIGGVEGFDRFYPDKITLNPYSAIPVITGLKISNKFIEPGDQYNGRIIYNKSLSLLDELQLTWKENDFSFYLGALHYSEPLKNKIAYKLEGYHNQWNYTTLQENEISFSNLPGGTYTLFLKVSNADGVWCEKPLELRITIIPPFWKSWWFYLICVFILLLTIWLWFKIRFENIKNQKRLLEEQVVSRTKEIVEKNSEILAQNEEIKAINEEIESQREKLQEVFEELTQNIQTAKRIQEAILPNEDQIKLMLPESFILFKPKDIVSGDFYWYYEKLGNIYIAAVDCTGHGVSGAFMSLIGKCLLDQILIENPMATAAQILDSLSKLLVKTLQQDQEFAVTKEGMDIALCIVDKEEGLIQFAGANNPLLIKQDTSLEVIKGDTFGIGLHKGKPAESFTNHVIRINQNSTYYIFSDGFVSQFGGNSGEEKFKISRFRELLLCAECSVQDQGSYLENILNDWQKSTPQTDDILVIGFNVS